MEASVDASEEVASEEEEASGNEASDEEASVEEPADGSEGAALASWDALRGMQRPRTLANVTADTNSTLRAVGRYHCKPRLWRIGRR